MPLRHDALVSASHIRRIDKYATLGTCATLKYIQGDNSFHKKNAHMAAGVSLFHESGKSNIISLPTLLKNLY